MDEWLLDPMHGLELGDTEEDLQPIVASDFLTQEAFNYFSAIQQKKPTYGMERKIRRLISRSIWPRILVARCRALIATALPLFVHGHWKFLEHILSFIRSVLHYLGLLLHGLRLMMNAAHLIQGTISTDSGFDALFQYLSHSWFELFTDIQCIISALTPSDYLVLSCSLMVLELAFIAVRAWNEAQRIRNHIKIINAAIRNQELQPDTLNELLRAKAHAEAMLAHTYKKLALNFGVTLLTTSLFFIKSVLLPLAMVSVAANPFMSFIFAVVALLVSVMNHYLNQYIDKEKPKTPMHNESRRDLFFYKKPAPMSKQLIQNTFTNIAEKCNAIY